MLTEMHSEMCSELRSEGTWDTTSLSETVSKSIYETG